MLLKYIFVNGLIYFLIVVGYLFIIMISLSPRIWGYADYSDEIKKKVPPQTRKEKIIATIIGIPWIFFTLGFPIYSSLHLKEFLGVNFLFVTAFLNILIMVLLVNLGDVFILDWLIVNKITPKFVIIPGTDKEDYKDFSHHYKSHIRAIIIQVLLCILLAGIVTL
jgi:hypothetical protein